LLDDGIGVVAATTLLLGPRTGKSAASRPTLPATDPRIATKTAVAACGGNSLATPPTTLVVARTRRVFRGRAGYRSHSRTSALLPRQLRELIDPEEVRAVKTKEVNARCRRRRVSCRTAWPRWSEGPPSVSPFLHASSKGARRGGLRAPWCGVRVVCRA